MSIVEKAVGVAMYYHGEQMYGEHPYLYHLSSVHTLLCEIFPDCTDEERAVAFLHDVVEDTSCTLEMLDQKGFPHNVVEAVDIITKREGVPRFYYIEKILELRDTEAGRMAWRVKVADTTANLVQSLKTMERRRILKYTDQLSSLTMGVDSVDFILSKKRGS